MSQVVEGINTILFNMIASNIPGQSRCANNSEAVEKLIRDVRDSVEDAMADGIGLLDFSTLCLNRSSPFTEPCEGSGLINHFEQSCYAWL